MDLGLFIPLSTFNANAPFLRALGPAVEERGFESGRVGAGQAGPPWAEL